MLSKASFISIVACVLVIALLGCQTSPTGGAIITQEQTGPKDVVVTSEPVSQPVAAQPAAQPKPAPVPPSGIPTNVLPRPEPQVIIIPESKPAADPYKACIDNCDSSCKISATYSCNKPSGADCKQSCGQIIDPSACSTACSLRSARVCEPKFIEFCTAQCIGKCH
jgi:hypothetical protein